MISKDKLFYLLFIVLALAVNLAGINVKFFTDDPGLYASIAKNMIYKHDLLSLYTNNQDWLDKPHFPFWMIMISFKLFGFSVWAYRLPALLFFIISLIYTYLFTRRYYNWEAGIIAVLIVITAEYVLMGNTDVRAEPYLMGLITGAIYHVAALDHKFTIKDFFMAALLTGCAIMTKGIFLLIPVAGALMGHLLMQRRFKSLFSIKWIGLFLLTLLITLPEFYALYLQFDLHPEKTVFHKHNVSGIKWFLWDSQFGRFTNSGPISQKKSSGDVFFYVHTLLWAFAPWCLLFYFALYKRIRSVLNKVNLPEYYTLSGALVLLLLFSISGFQLPFYTNTIFPLFAIITAPYCYQKLSPREDKLRLASLWIYIIPLTLIVFIINYYLQPNHNGYFTFGCVAFFLLISLISKQHQEANKKAFFLACAASLFANFYLATTLYPVLASYSGQIPAARYVNQPQFADRPVYALKPVNNVFQFEVNKPVDFVFYEGFTAFKAPANSIFYATQEVVDYLNQHNVSYKIEKAFVNYPQERILPKFINKATRGEVLDKVYLITK